jgi:predicted DsbA family dithiol-disulfide isomerase
MVDPFGYHNWVRPGLTQKHRYMKSRYGGSEERMKMYTSLMSAYGMPLGINFRFDGIVANTLQAHRLVQHYQEEKGEDVATKIINCKQFTPP